MNKILFIDTLTTGLNTERCAIYRIGGIFCLEDFGTIAERVRFELYMKPFEGARIMDNSLWLSGTTRSRLIYYPDQKDAFGQFRQMVSQNIDIRNSRDKIYLAGYNTSVFDAPFIRQWFERNGDVHFRDCFHVQALDMMSLSAFALMNERSNMPDFHMETAARFLGVTPVRNERYSCLDNADTCLLMYKALKRRLAVGEDRRHDVTENIITNFRESW